MNLTQIYDKTSVKKTTKTTGYNQGENIKRFHSLRPVIKNWLNYRKNSILEENLNLISHISMLADT
jgi:hypothetical protein